MAAKYLDAIMLFGDSITQGAWEMNGVGARLAHIYARKLDVLNRGFSGYNTDWAFPVFEKVLAKQHEQHHVPRVRLLTIWFGANDACLPHSPQHVPLARFSANLRKMIYTVKSPASPFYSPVTKIILIAPPPVNTIQRGADLASREPARDLDRDFETTRQYAKEVLEVGAREGVPVVDIWTALWEAAGKEERGLERFLYDGLHLNEEGYRIAYEELLKIISEHYPELKHDQMQYVFPAWGFFIDHSVEDFKSSTWIQRYQPPATAGTVASTDLENEKE
ncbi:SGNH hydrolase [Dentipellis sp. KUC8613]|nr:SGNH hydrolase [Dentipellis sp. KUC8613]